MSNGSNADSWAKRLARISYQTVQTYGFDPRQALHGVVNLPKYVRDLARFSTMSRGVSDAIPLGIPFPHFDAASASGVASGHYFHQDLLVAQRIFQRAPARHVDVGSRVDGFVAHVASFRHIEVLDIRAAPNPVTNVVFREVDVMSLPQSYYGYTESLSCLHALEHFGLGRYGDPLHPFGHVLGLENLHRLLSPGGTLYLSVPIGPTRVEFNAHRVFSVPYLLSLFAGKFRVRAFSYVDDSGALHVDASHQSPEAGDTFGCKYGCGIFELEKL